ncbi:MAG: MerR family transcriptional regulator [Bdellovibrionales bacterium]|nr:MerR family transcriptional regulator [Bdellovibrionales bacterium]
MMKADPKSVTAKEIRSAVADDAILSAFDPVVEGSTFQIFEEGLDPKEFSRLADLSDEIDAPEVLSQFDLAESLARVPSKLFFRIGEVAELLDVKTYVLRFWETEFPMVSPQKSRSGQRVYRKKDVEMLLLIKHLLYVERFSIEGARKRIRELKQKPAASVAGAKAGTVKGSAAVLAGVAVKVTTAKSAALAAADRETLRASLGEIEKLANPEISRFFRF